MAADWAELHDDMLVCIVEKISLIEDFVAFGSVCKSWRESTSIKHYLRPQIPWLMLTDNDETKQYYRQIYSLSKEDILTKNLYIPEMYDKKCIGLNYGWVLTISRKGEMNLLHPLSRSQIDLPHQKSIDYYEQDRTWPSYIFVSSAALSANPFESAEFVVMIVHGGSGLYLSYWRSPAPGQEKQRWTMITNQAPKTLYCDLTYYQDRFYAIEYSGNVWDCKVSGDRDDRTLVGTIDRDLISYDEAYIVESEGDLLVVVRQEQANDGCIREDITEENSEGEEEEVITVHQEVGYWTFDFQVYRLDLIKGGYKEIQSLGDRAIFVGHNTSISLDVSEFRGGLIKSNHIHFCDDNMERYNYVKRGGGKDMGSYNFKDGRFTRFKVDESLSRSRISPPFWFIPSL